MADEVARRLCPLPANAEKTGHRLFSEVLAGYPNASNCYTRIGNFQAEESEAILENLCIKAQTKQWHESRQKDLVYEDNFNPSVIKMAKSGTLSYKNLIDVCKKYENRAQVDEHGRISNSTYSFFMNLMESQEEAKAAAFAIAFYTGSQSGGISRGASLIARQSNGEVTVNMDEEHLDHVTVILYYLVKGLCHIPYYWGVSCRAIDLKEDEFHSYTPGNLMAWFQFSSSKRGTSPPKAFAHRNTYFIIQSLTGRSIAQFSSFEDEDEILFLPHSTFLVLEHKLEDGRHMIYLRQVELGFSKWSILWVDDHILDHSWQNKEHMERASTRALQRNVHFIPKSTTENAVSFLRSPFGQRLKNSENFRIVTDMKRDNESSPKDAGIRLVKEIRRLGFNNHCLIFTGSKSKADMKIQAQLSPNECLHLLVTEESSVLDRFVGFDE